MMRCSCLSHSDRSPQHLFHDNSVIRRFRPSRRRRERLHRRPAPSRRCRWRAPAAPARSWSAPAAVRARCRRRVGADQCCRRDDAGDDATGSTLISGNFAGAVGATSRAKISPLRMSRLMSFSGAQAGSVALGEVLDRQHRGRHADSGLGSGGASVAYCGAGLIAVKRISSIPFPKPWGNEWYSEAVAAAGMKGAFYKTKHRTSVRPECPRSGCAVPNVPSSVAQQQHYRALTSPLVILKLRRMSRQRSAAKRINRGLFLTLKPRNVRLRACRILLTPGRSFSPAASYFSSGLQRKESHQKKRRLPMSAPINHLAGD